MEITLSPELEAMVREEVASGRFASVDEFFAEVVEQFHERKQWRGESLEELKESLETAWQEAEREELTPIEDFREEMRHLKSAGAEQQRRA